MIEMLLVSVHGYRHVKVQWNIRKGVVEAEAVGGKMLDDSDVGDDLGDHKVTKTHVYDDILLKNSDTMTRSQDEHLRQHSYRYTTHFVPAQCEDSDDHTSIRGHEYIMR